MDIKKERKMSCDSACEEVGTISYFYNKILWTIPKFYDLEKNIRFKSPQFTLMGSTWQLRYCCFRSTLNSKQWLDIGVKFLTKTTGFEGLKVRFGITGNNLEISKTLQSNDLPKYYSLTLPYEDDMYAWVPEGNLCLFLTIENPDQNRGADTSFKEKEETGGNDTKQINGKAFVEVSTQTEQDSGTWKLPEDFKEFLLNGNISDIVLKVGEEEFKSHKCILAARSPVFLDMMTQETQENNIGVLDIQDVDPNTFFVFLKYLYTGSEDNITSENAHELFTVAIEYQVYELKKVCLDHMLRNISVENFCDIFSLSLLHENHELIDACSEFFIKNSLDIIVTSKWQLFLSENPVVGNGLYIRLLKLNK